MFKLDDNFLIELGLGSLPPAEKNKMLSHIYETLEMKVGMRLAEKMTNEQLDEFESYINSNDEQGALKWLETNFPNYKQVVAEELEKLKSEIKQVAPQILAQAAAAPQQQAGPQQMNPAAQPQQMAPPAPAQSQAAYDTNQPAPYQQNNTVPAPQQPYAPAPPAQSYAAPAQETASAYQPQQQSVPSQGAYETPAPFDLSAATSNPTQATPSHVAGSQSATPAYAQQQDIAELPVDPLTTAPPAQQPQAAPSMSDSFGSAAPVQENPAAGPMVSQQIGHDSSPTQSFQQPAAQPVSSAGAPAPYQAGPTTTSAPSLGSAFDQGAQSQGPIDQTSLYQNMPQQQQGSGGLPTYDQVTPPSSSQAAAPGSAPSPQQQDPGFAASPPPVKPYQPPQ